MNLAPKPHRDGIECLLESAQTVLVSLVHGVANGENENKRGPRVVLGKGSVMVVSISRMIIIRT